MSVSSTQKKIEEFRKRRKTRSNQVSSGYLQS